jgi:hypothetical protein
LPMDGSLQMGFRQRPSWRADAVRGAVHPIIPAATRVGLLPADCVEKLQFSRRSQLVRPTRRIEKFCLGGSACDSGCLLMSFLASAQALSTSKEARAATTPFFDKKPIRGFFNTIGGKRAFKGHLGKDGSPRYSRRSSLSAARRLRLRPLPVKAGHGPSCPIGDAPIILHEPAPQRPCLALAVSFSVRPTSAAPRKRMARTPPRAGSRRSCR